MDTGTHLVVGLGLAGLAYIDPVVAADSHTSTAILIGTVLGSQAPDFDGLLRFRSNAAYIRNHRGMSHSLPAMVLWTGLITLMLLAIFRHLPVLHVVCWVGIAVVLHVFSDLFNSYGTQALRPFTQKWIAWNIIHIFDPVIFVTHLIAIFSWSVHIAPPGVIFPILYGFLVIYYVWRTMVHTALRRKLPYKDATYRQGESYLLIPTINLYTWHVVKQRLDNTYQIGELRNERLYWVDEVACAAHPAVEASKLHPDIAAFLYFSSFSCAEIIHHVFGYEVRWVDVRYRHRRQYPFVAVVLLDHDYQPLSSYVGWLSEAKLAKKVGFND